MRAEASVAVTAAQRKLAFSSDTSGAPAAKRQRSDGASPSTKNASSPKRAIVISLLDDADGDEEDDEASSVSDSGDRISDASTRLAKENELRVFVREDPDVILVWSSMIFVDSAAALSDSGY